MSYLVCSTIKLTTDFIYPIFSNLLRFWAGITIDLWFFWIGIVCPKITSPWNHFISAIVLLLCFFGYRALFKPYNRIKLPHEIGYDYIKGECGGKKEFIRNINNILKRRKIGDLPPIYPNGWFALLESNVLSKGKVKHVTALGENFAVFRGENGVTKILDAYCPHLGANMGVGGIVQGNCLQCPFHGWEFDGTGKCTKIPYTKNIPNVAKVKSWHCAEKNGFIFVWYHCDDVEPEWEIQDIEVLSRRWKYCGRSEHYINSHIQDIPENAGDIAHLGHLHGPAIFGGSDIRYTTTSIWTKVMRHHWEANWTQDAAPNKHLATMDLNHHVTIFGKVLKPISIKVAIKQVGPSLVHLRINSVFGTVILIQAVTPIEPLQQRVIHTAYAERGVPTVIVKALMYSESWNFERDIMVWNSKKYIPKPILVKEDALINKHRRWFAQFYSENSPKFQFQNETLDW